MVRSGRRRKTVAAREVDGVLRVSVPASMSAAEAQRWVARMVGRMERRAQATAVDLERRAERLAARYRLHPPRSIRWVDNQHWRWGSCTPERGSIRISSRLAQEPGWVLDYVIVHELVHLDIADHGPRFWAHVHRYPQAERAIGFLIARSRPSGGGGSGGGVGGGDDCGIGGGMGGGERVGRGAPGAGPAKAGPHDDGPSPPPPGNPTAAAFV